MIQDLIPPLLRDQLGWLRNCLIPALLSDQLGWSRNCLLFLAAAPVGALQTSSGHRETSQSNVTSYSNNILQLDYQGEPYCQTWYPYLDRNTGLLKARVCRSSHPAFISTVLPLFFVFERELLCICSSRQHFVLFCKSLLCIHAFFSQAQSAGLKQQEVVASVCFAHALLALGSCWPHAGLKMLTVL